MPRILKLLDDYDIKATFYIPGYVAENYEDMVKDIVKKGHEVGHHGYMHEALGNMPIDQETEILERGMEILERITGAKTLGYRAPFFDCSLDTIRLLAEHGFAYDTSMHDSDRPYIHEVSGNKLVEVPVKWVLDDYGYFAFIPQAGRRSAMQDPQAVYETYAAEFDGAYKEGNVMTVTLHPRPAAALPDSPPSSALSATPSPTPTSSSGAA